MPIKTIHNEKELLGKIAKGNQRAFADLFDAYYQQLGEYVFKLTESQEITDEIVQDVFMKVWQKKKLLPDLNNFTYYLFILSRNRTLNYLRKKANEHARYLEWARQCMLETRIPNDSGTVEYHLLIDAAIAQLPQQQKKVYLLSRHERMKYREIASKLNISPGTVKKHMQLALNAIKQYVHAHKNNSAFLALLFFLVLC